MVNFSTPEIDREDKNQTNELIVERKKTVTHCLNLECRNEQLKILIEKLHNLTNQREELIAKNSDSKAFSEELSFLYPKNSSIVNELEMAKENSSKLEKAIQELKKRISRIDKILSE